MVAESEERATWHALDRPRESLWRYLRLAGNKLDFSMLDEYLGDFPATRRIRKLANKLRRTGGELREMAESPNDGVRRIARLIIALDRPFEPAFFRRGITDNYSVIRSDTVRLAVAGTDRTRLYNQLVRLIREDPDARVRRTAGKRLRESFADLYSIDYEGLSPLSRMLLLDSLDGYAQIDEKYAETLLFSENPELAFRAARKLLEWGILRRHFESKSGVKLLMRAAELKVVDFLEHARIDAGNRSLARILSEKANRDDLTLLFSESGANSSRQGKEFTQVSKEIQQIVQELANCNPCEKGAAMAAISKFPMQEVKQTIEDAYPKLSSENCAEFLIEIARRGRWIDWQERIIEAAESESPDIRREAILALPELKGESSAPEISPFLFDKVERVRVAAAQALALLPSNGFAELTRYLATEPEGEIRKSIIEGIRKAGSTSTLNCLIENPNLLPPDLIKEIFNQGIDESGVKLLARSGNGSEVIRLGGFHAGKSIFLAWEGLESEEKAKLLRCIEKSNWVYSVLVTLREKSTGFEPFLKHLSRKETLKLFEKALQNESPEKRRLLKNRLLRKLR